MDELGIRSVFDTYIDAFNNVDADRIAEIYHYPSLTVRADGSVHVLSDENVVRDFMGGVAQAYYDEGNRAGTYDKLEIRAIGGKSAVADVTWSLRGDDGLVIRQWNQTYNLLLTGGSWRFVLTTIHV